MHADSRNPMTLARFELRRFKGPLPRLALAFILLIPLLYGCIYLAGNWDPYGRLDNVPVAVVNEDVSTTVNGGEVHAGRDFVDSLHRDAKFDFRDTDAADAEAGLREGRYYLVISVPPTFSSDLVSGQTDDPTRARIMLRRNDANGFVIGAITNSAQDSIAKAIDETAVSSYFEAVFASLDTIRAAMSSAADGAAQLDAGLATAHDGSARLRSGASDAATGADALATGATRLATGAATASEGAASLAEGMTTLDEGAASLKDGSRQVADGTAQLTDTLDPVLTLAAERLPTVQADVTKAADAAADLTGQIAEGGGTIAGASADIARSLDDLLATNPSLADDPAFKRLRSGAERLSSATDTAAQGARDVAEAVNRADQTIRGAGDLSAKATEAKTKVDLLNSGAQQVAAGASDLRAGTATALAGARSLDDGLGDLASGAEDLRDGAGTLAGGLGSLSEGSVTLDDGLAQLSTGAHELSTGLADGVTQIPVLTDDEEEDAVSVLSAPVDVGMQVDNPAHVYGRGLAPMFFSIALWVLGISAFFVVRPITGRVLAARGSDVRIAVTAWAPLGLISLVAGWLMLAAAWVGLGLDPVHPWLMILLVSLVSLAFSAVAHLMRTWLGFVATAAMLVLLIIQLTAAGGTYPPELLPPFFAAISHVVPMTYSIDAFRIAISGGLMTRFVRDIALLLVLFASSMALLVFVVHRRRRFRITDLHPPLG